MHELHEPQWWRDTRWQRAKFSDVNSRLGGVKDFLEPITDRARRFSKRTWVFIGSFVVFLFLFSFWGAGIIDLPFLPSHRPPPRATSPAPPADAYPPYPKVEGGLIDWVPPDMDPLIHGVRASEGIHRKPNYELRPFPVTPMENEPHDDMERPWLGAVICTAWDVKRRMMIRATWMKMYKNVPMDQRFVVSNPGPWTPVLQQENATYGDMIVLDHIPEDDFTANTIKTIEFYRWLREKSPKKYQFVSKLDTDLWINAKALWERHLLPRLDKSADGTMVANVNKTVVGQFYYSFEHKTAFPHGALYTATWDIVELLPSLQDEFHVIAGEDVTMAWLLMKGKHKITIASLTEAEKFEFDKKDIRPGEKWTAWARNTTDLTSQWHAIYGKDVIGVHQLKSDNDWLVAAECFDENGIKDGPTEPENAPGPDDDAPGYPRAWFHNIPERWWEVDTDGGWLVNGVWKTEPGVDRTTMLKVDEAN